MKFGEKVRAARIAAHLTQKQLSERTGLSLRTVLNYESGERMPKSRDTYYLLADALALDVSALLDENAEFVLKAAQTYGSRGQAQTQRLIEEVRCLYAGGELAEEDMDAMMRAIQDAYWIAKQKNRRGSRRPAQGAEESADDR